MYHELSIQESEIIRSKLLKTLDDLSITRNGYWFPLCDVSKKVKCVSFYVEDIDNENWIIIFDILKTLGINRIFEIQELIEEIRIYNFDNYFLEKDEDGYDMLYMSECYWFDENHNYLIYTSHEHTISFTGNDLVQKIIRNNTLKLIIKEMFYQNI